jgi:hypothetical protein
MTDFMNFKIKSAQFFKYTHKSRLYVYIFIEISIYTYISIYVYTIFFKKRCPCQFYNLSYHFRT